jgi:transcriptional regulator with XRE-family HTH domain
MLSTTQSGTFGERMADAREAKGFTLLQLAKSLGVTRDTIDGWEKNRSAPRSNRISMIAGVLDVSVVWLLEGHSAYEPTASRGTRVDTVASKLERVLNMQEELGRLIAEISSEVGEIQRIEAELDELAA